MKRIDWASLDATQRRQILQRPAQLAGAKVSQAVETLIAQVREQGDDAVAALTQRFDGVALSDFAVSDAEFESAQAQVSPALRQAIDDAAARIRRFHEAGMSKPYQLATAEGVICERIIRPIQRVGLYVPAGSAPLPSTALMLGVPAALAGCPETVMCTPPRRDGSADPAVLYAARSCGVTRVFKIGGVQAIAAMAFGTARVPKCDKLFGPGNGYVTEAKRQVAMSEGGAAIDMPAGPSEVLVIADAGANPVFVAADLLSQAEHGPDSQVILVSDSDALLAQVDMQIESQLQTLTRSDVARLALSASRLIKVDTLQTAFDISNEYAPEHLILAVREPRQWLSQVTSAGSVFLGDWAPVALGDYCSGTNHVLPTGAAARHCGGLNVASFQLAITVQEVQRAGLQAIGPCTVELANAEGLDAHRQSVALRLEAV